MSKKNEEFMNMTKKNHLAIPTKWMSDSLNIFLDDFIHVFIINDR
jgi:hypothetical protein